MMDLPEKGGFSFDLCRRNDSLEKNGLKIPGFLKTGTTIVGLVFQVRPHSLCRYSGFSCQLSGGLRIW
jgi:hypothetical protein